VAEVRGRNRPLERQTSALEGFFSPGMLAGVALTLGPILDVSISIREVPTEVWGGLLYLAGAGLPR
jgi:hypothetical protein